MDADGNESKGVDVLEDCGVSITCLVLVKKFTEIDVWQYTYEVSRKMQL